MLKLVQLPISLYSFKVRLALVLMRADVTLVEPPDGTYRSPAYRALVAPGTIPALLGPDGVLTESDAIIEYLDETVAGSRLMRGSAARRARIRMLTRLNDLRLEVAVRSLFGHIAPAKRDIAEIARARERIVEALGVVEWALDPKGPFAIDDTASMADCAIAATSSWLAALQPDLLPGLALGPRFARVLDTLRTDPVTGPHVTAYAKSVATWIDERKRS